MVRLPYRFDPLADGACCYFAIDSVQSRIDFRVIDVMRFGEVACVDRVSMST